MKIYSDYNYRFILIFTKNWEIHFVPTALKIPPCNYSVRYSVPLGLKNCFPKICQFNTNVIENTLLILSLTGQNVDRKKTKKIQKCRRYEIISYPKFQKALPHLQQKNRDWHFVNPLFPQIHNLRQWLKVRFLFRLQCP